jgi:Xaa-Pro aminopeptidase
VTPERALLMVDFRYVEQAKLESPQFEISYIKSDISEWLPASMLELGATSLGIEAEHTSLSQYQRIVQSMREKSPSVQVKQSTNAVELLRQYKDDAELQNIIKACDIADRAVDYIKTHLRAGVSERQFAWELESFMRQNDSETMPFEIIVASGPNAALPHAKPGEKIIAEGEPVTIDMGARYQGYCSDITRTFIIGKEDNSFNNIYNIVLGAQTAGLLLIKPEMEASVADGLVRSMIGEAGFSENFGHGLGHGIGIETHELPRLGTKSEDRLQEGMVFTIEPGVYIPGWGGIRIEDTVTIKDGKIVCLTKSDKNALIAGGQMP